MSWALSLAGQALLGYYALAIVASVLSALLDMAWGLESLYLAALDSVFAWAVKWCHVLEEDEPTTADEISQIIESRAERSNSVSGLAKLVREGGLAGLVKGSQQRLPSSASKQGLIDKHADARLRPQPPKEGLVREGGLAGLVKGSQQRLPSSASKQGLIDKHADARLRPQPPNEGEEPLPEGSEPLEGLTSDLMSYARAGLEAVVDDELAASMSVEELPYWNLLARNRGLYSNFKPRLQLVWFLGFLFRYIFLAPVRVALLLIGLAFLSVMTMTLSRVGDAERRREWGLWLTRASFRLFSRTISLAATFHAKENAKRAGGGIAVANHTSPIDAIVLNTEVAYCLTGQKHGGWLGFACESLAKIVPHLWFERSSSKDRGQVKEALARHAANAEHPPTLIFPEGVCVNNTAVVMFKKGAFEASDTIYPIAMRYDPKYGDPFWGFGGWTEHIVAMLTSWAIVVDVHYLPPMERKADESAAQFADRVKAAIATKIGLRFLRWDGRLHNYTVVKPELVEEQRRVAATRIRNLSGGRSAAPSLDKPPQDLPGTGAVGGGSEVAGSGSGEGAKDGSGASDKTTGSPSEAESKPSADDHTAKSAASQPEAAFKPLGGDSEDKGTQEDVEKEP